MPESKWVLGALTSKLKTTLQRDWNRTALAERRAWAGTVLAGIVAVIASLFLMIFVLQTTVGHTGHFPWEAKFLQTIEAGPVRFGTGVWLQTLGSDFMLVFVTITAAGMAVWTRRPLLAISIVLALLTMDAFVRIGWFSFARVRPDLIAQGMASPGFHSFPSGHTSKTVVVYGLLAFQWLRASRNTAEKSFVAVLTLIITAIVPLGRLRMGVHWPTDIIGGYVMGVVWAAFLIAAVNRERPARDDV